MVHACQKYGDCASDEVRELASRIKGKDAEDFARTKHKGLPDRVKKKKGKMKKRKNKQRKSFHEYLSTKDPVLFETLLYEYEQPASLSNVTQTAQVNKYTGWLQEPLGQQTNMKRKMLTIWQLLKSSALPPSRLTQLFSWYRQWFKQQGLQDDQGVEAKEEK